MMSPPIGVLQGRLTPSNGRGIQFFPDENWEQEFYIARDIGLSCIEPLVRPTNLRTHPLMTPEGRARLQELSRETGVSIPSVHGYTPKGDTYEQDLVDIVRATKEIGAEVILISFFKEGRISSTPDETWERAHRLVAPGAREAVALGVKLGIETELPAATVLDFISKAETPEAFGVYYDLGNQFACGFPVVEELLLLASKVVGVHIKDRLPNTDPAHESSSVPIGEGNADFPGAFRALRDIGYSRPLIFQGARGEDGKERELYGRYLATIRTICNTIWN